MTSISNISELTNLAGRLRSAWYSRLLMVLLLSTLPAVVQTQGDTLEHSAPVLGTAKGHEELWRQREAIEGMNRASEAEAQSQSRREQDLEEQVTERKAALQAIKEQKPVQPKEELFKGEFETTTEFEQRCRTAEKAAAAAAAAAERKAVADFGQANIALREFKEYQRVSRSSMNRSDTSTTPSRKLFVPVTMDHYDPDQGRIPGFTIINPYKVGEISGVPQLFQFDGMISGIRVDNVTAQQIRQTSATAGLVAALEATSILYGFETCQTETIAPARPAKQEDTEKAVLSLAVAAVAALLGSDNPGQIGADARANLDAHPNNESLVNSGSPEITKTHLVRLIRAGWSGKASVKSL